MKNALINLYVKSQVSLRSVLEDQRGVTAIEYAIVGVAIAAIVAYVMGENGPLRDALLRAMTSITESIDSAGQTPGS